MTEYIIRYTFDLKAQGVQEAEKTHKAVGELNKKYGDLTQELKRVKAESAQNTIQKSLIASGVAAKKTEASIRGVAKATGEVSDEMKKFSKAKDLEKVNEEAEFLTKNFAEAVKEARALNEATEKLNKLRAERDRQAGKKGADDGTKISEKVGGVVSQATGFDLSSLATPQTAALAGATAVATGIALITSRAIEGAKEIAHLQTTIKGLTGLTGTQLTAASVKIKALSDTFEQDTEQIILAVNTISKTRGLTFQQATTVVNDQLLRGLDAEGVKQLIEYDVQMKKIGFTAVQTGDFIRESRQAGFYDDKAIDALKETKIKLDEFSQAAVDALRPLGPEFNVQLKKDLKEGNKTTIEIVDNIIKQADKVKLSSQDTQLLIADLLGGSPGEDAGGRKLLDFLTQFIQKQNELRPALNATEKATLDLQHANEGLAEEYAKFNTNTAGATRGLKLFAVEAEALGIKILNTFADSLNKANSYLKQFFGGKGVFQASNDFFRDTLNSLGILNQSSDQLKKMQDEVAKFEQLPTETAPDKQKNTFFGTQAPAGPPPEFEVKIKADTKPFETQIEKVKTDLQALNDAEAIANIQNEFDLNNVGRNVSEGQAIREATDLAEKIAKINEIAFERNLAKDAQKRKEEAIKNLDEQRKTSLEELAKAELSEGFKAQKRVEIAQKYAEEQKRIEKATADESVANEQIVQEKRAEMVAQFARRRELEEARILEAQIKNVQALEREIIKTRLSTAQQTIGAGSDFDARTQLLKDQKDEELSILEESFNKEITAEGLSEEQQLQLARRFNAQLLQIELRHGDDLAKIRQERINRYFEIELKGAQRLEEQARNLQDTISKINSTVKGDAINSGAAQGSALAGGIAQLGGSIASTIRARTERSKDIATANAELEALQGRLGELQDEAKRKRDIAENDPDAKVREKAKQDLEALEKQINSTENAIGDAFKKLDDFKNLDLKGKIKEVADLVGTSASVFTQIVEAGVRAQINSLNQLEKVQTDKIEKIKAGLAEGTKARQKFSAEELQVEEQKLKEIQKMKADAARKEQAIAVIQLVTQSAVAIAKAAAEGGIAAPITIATTLIALAAGLAQARAQAQAAIGGFFLGGYTGDGNPHEVAGVVHKGEFVMPHDRVEQYRKELEAMRKGDYQPQPEKAGFPVKLVPPVSETQLQIKEAIRLSNVMMPKLFAPVIELDAKMKALEAQRHAREVQMAGKLDEVAKKLEDIAYAINNQEIKAEARIDENGYLAMLTKRNKFNDFVKKKTQRKH